MESLKLHYANSTVHLALFNNVTNSSTLRQRLINASTLADDDEGERERSIVDYAFIDAAMVCTYSHLTLSNTS